MHFIKFIIVTIAVLFYVSQNVSALPLDPVGSNTLSKRLPGDGLSDAIRLQRLQELQGLIGKLLSKGGTKGGDKHGSKGGKH
jgi:hypothetical protein